MKYKMHFDIKGKSNKKQVLLIHGWSHSSAVWDKVVEDLAIKYQVITVDLLGHGNSDSPEHSGSLIEFLSKNLFELIESENWKLHGIISHSMGGLIALNILKNHSLSIEKLMIIGTPYNGLPFWVSNVGKLDKLVKLALTTRNKLPYKMSKLISKAGSKYTVKDLNTMPESLYIDIEKGNPEYISRLFKEMANKGFKLDKKLNIKSILISRGEYDPLSSRISLTKLARFLNGEYYQFRNVSHTVPIEAPSELKKVIFNLLD